MDQQTRLHIRELSGFLELHQDILVIDACTYAADTGHLHEPFRKKYASTPDYYHGRPASAGDLIQEMELAGVAMCLVSPDPGALYYPGDIYNNFEALLAANRYVHESVVNYPRRFIPAGWTDAEALGLEYALKMVDICVSEYGFLIIGLNPVKDSCIAGMESVWYIMNRIIGLGAVPAVHYGAGTLFAHPERLTELAGRYREHPVILIFSGTWSAGWLESEESHIMARQLGLQFPDIKFILCMRRDTHTESDLITYQLAGWPFSGNLFCGSGAPYGRMAWNFGGFRWMLLGLMDIDHHTDERIRNNPGLFDEEVMRNYLGGNLARFLISGYKNLLRRHKQEE